VAAADNLAGAISDQRLIGEVLDSMPSTLRIPLLLCDMDELTYEEVAQSLGISLSAAKMRIKRGRDLFREQYQKVKSTRVSLGVNER
jgi:RNA polymerase sigma-70 factor (ECF subfamily)